MTCSPTAITSPGHRRNDDAEREEVRGRGSADERSRASARGAGWCGPSPPCTPGSCWSRTAASGTTPMNNDKLLRHCARQAVSGGSVQQGAEQRPVPDRPNVHAPALLQKLELARLHARGTGAWLWCPADVGRRAPTVERAARACVRAQGFHRIRTSAEECRLPAPYRHRRVLGRTFRQPWLELVRGSPPGDRRSRLHRAGTAGRSRPPCPPPELESAVRDTRIVPGDPVGFGLQRRDTRWKSVAWARLVPPASIPAQNSRLIPQMPIEHPHPRWPPALRSPGSRSASAGASRRSPMRPRVALVSGRAMTSASAAASSRSGPQACRRSRQARWCGRRCSPHGCVQRPHRRAVALPMPPKRPDRAPRAPSSVSTGFHMPNSPLASSA